MVALTDKFLAVALFVGLLQVIIQIDDYDNENRLGKGYGEVLIYREDHCNGKHQHACHCV